MSQATTESAQADKVRAKVTRLGTGKRATVSVKLNDNSKLKGYIGQIAENGFTVVDPKHGTVTPVPYDQVQQVKKSSDHRWILSIVGAVGTVVGLMLLVAISLRGS